MKCKLCDKTIEQYDVRFHHLVIDENHAVDICQECIDKFVKWQSKMLAILFPTKILKKRYGEK